MIVNLDIPRPGRGLVTFREANLAGGIIREGRLWYAEDGDAGLVVGKPARTRVGAVHELAAHYGIAEPLEIVIEVERD